MPAEWTIPIGSIKGIGSARANLFSKLGIFTLGDLLSWFPRDYEDRTTVKPIAHTMIGETVCVKATVRAQFSQSKTRKGLFISKGQAVDDTGTMDLTFFNQAYIKTALRPGEMYFFYGRIEGTFYRREMKSPIFESVHSAGTVTNCIAPIYRLTAGITGNLFSRIMAAGLQACKDIFPEPLPNSVREAHQLAHASFAYEKIHFPKSFAELDVARRRLIFEELFVLSAGLALLKKGHRKKQGQALPPVPMAPLEQAFPFSLTGAQQRVIGEIAADMARSHPMNRLIQGDVGSGKTAVAAAAVWQAVQNGCQAALMVPTGILAEQHHQSFSALLSPHGVRVALLTSSLTARDRKRVLHDLAAGDIDFVVGTHALLSAGVFFAKLGLVITDEQHRFGVNQRAALAAKGAAPHILVMSATPIPRTLALIVYGDLEVSLLDEMPPGRQAIQTVSVGNDMRPRIYNFVRKQVAAGRQVYIVCPAVEENPEESSKQSVVEYAQYLHADIFSNLRVSYVHGRMKNREKEAVMAAFAAGDFDILVATTVIEVGVDIPNASLMIVENAECFGLSQLHQLRGRVGRGPHPSYCILISDGQGADTKSRLQVMCQTSDGFLIAEEDLKIRGPGDFFGARQHGLPDFKIANLTKDMQILLQAQRAALQTVEQDPQLKLPEHKLLLRQIQVLFSKNGDIFT